MTAARPQASAVWVCPSAVILSADEIAAALYTYSDLADDYPEPSGRMVREEVRFLIARYGTAEIEAAAERVAGGQPRRFVLVAGQARERLWSHSRLEWCRRQAIWMCDLGDPSITASGCES